MHMTCENAECIKLSLVQIASHYQIIDQDFRHSFPCAPRDPPICIGYYVEYAVLDVMLLRQSRGLYMDDSVKQIFTAQCHTAATLRCCCGNECSIPTPPPHTKYLLEDVCTEEH